MKARDSLEKLKKLNKSKDKEQLYDDIENALDLLWLLMKHIRLKKKENLLIGDIISDDEIREIERRIAN